MTKCSNCGAAVSPDEVTGGVCKFCGAVLEGAPAGPAGQAAAAAPVGTVGAQVDQLLASLGVQPGTAAMSHVQAFLAAQQAHVVQGVTYGSFADMPPEARQALVLSLLAQRQAMMQGLSGAVGAQAGRKRRGSGCGCFLVVVLIIVGGVVVYLYGGIR